MFETYHLLLVTVVCNSLSCSFCSVCRSLKHNFLFPFFLLIWYLKTFQTYRTVRWHVRIVKVSKNNFVALYFSTYFRMTIVSHLNIVVRTETLIFNTLTIKPKKPIGEIAPKFPFYPLTWIDVGPRFLGSHSSYVSFDSIFLVLRRFRTYDNVALVLLKIPSLLDVRVYCRVIKVWAKDWLGILVLAPFLHRHKVKSHRKRVVCYFRACLLCCIGYGATVSLTCSWTLYIKVKDSED